MKAILIGDCTVFFKLIQFWQDKCHVQRDELITSTWPLCHLHREKGMCVLINTKVPNARLIVRALALATGLEYYEQVQVF